jgi:hypothetical protein
MHRAGVWHGQCNGSFTPPRRASRHAPHSAVIDMAFRPRASDRRSARFEVVGALSGTLVASHILAVRNFSCSGALVQSPRPLTPRSEHTIEFESHAGTVVIRARVVRTSPSEGSTHSIALEFVDVHPETLQQIQRMLSLEAAGG